MDLYHSWLYQKIFNTEWFMWIIVSVTLGINLLAPIIVWMILNFKRLMKKPADANGSSKKQS